MSLADRVRALGSPRILVAGDLILDHYVHGTVDRVSPEAPIGVLKVAAEEFRLGGAACVARNLAVLGARVGLLGFVGEDEGGDEVLSRAEAAGIDAAGVLRVPGRATSRKTRLIARRGAGGQQVLRVDREETEPYPVGAEAGLLAGIEAAVAGADLLVLSSYAKGALSADLTRAAIKVAREAGVRVLADPKPPGMARFRGATALTPNRSETAAFVGFSPDDAAARERAAKRLLEELELEAVAITLDRDGIHLAEKGGGGERFPVPPREVFDVTGAGDMVISVLAMVVAAGGSYGEAVRLANVASGIVVSRLGVVSVTREEILEALHRMDPDERGKRVPLPHALEIVAARRQRGERVVFTNGCFDVLHIGHVRLLEAARAEGDCLVVGLNSDESVRRLKGEGRPVAPEAQRVEVLSALSCVDLVLIFDEDTPLTTIEAVRPDVLVKGEDWREKGVVGREVVEARGGRIVLVPLSPGISSTEIIRRIREDEE